MEFLEIASWSVGEGKVSVSRGKNKLISSTERRERDKNNPHSGQTVTKYCQYLILSCCGTVVCPDYRQIHSLTGSKCNMMDILFQIEKVVRHVQCLAHCTRISLISSRCQYIWTGSIEERGLWRDRLWRVVAWAGRKSRGTIPPCQGHTKTADTED